ncbi:MAG: class I SAM-dependent methyltransferase [Planctomycetota bacterium]|nr:class I SAM-dependent methyltransferase [Planctomycetota bacterium]
MSRKPAPEFPDRYALYEACVTDGPRLARFAEAVHGKRPRTLAEHFSGTGALARAWAALSPRHRAIAVDSDPEPLARLAEVPRVTVEVADVRRSRERADVIAATNFPVGYLHDRRELVAYLKHARARLAPGGVFFCDTYGGRDALSPLTLVRTVKLGMFHVEQSWEQREADARTNLVLDVLHFRVKRGKVVRRLRDAFTYHWRLWSLTELRDAMLDAGFRAVEVHDRLGGAIDGSGRLHVRPMGDNDRLDENWVAYVVARR